MWLVEANSTRHKSPGRGGGGGGWGEIVKRGLRKPCQKLVVVHCLFPPINQNKTNNTNNNNMTKSIVVRIDLATTEVITLSTTPCAGLEFAFATLASQMQFMKKNVWESQNTPLESM